MYFIRKYKTGTSDCDPRQKEYAVYHCNACNKDEHIDVTYNFTFDFIRARLCPKCKSFGTQDKLNSLKTEINELTKKKSSIEIKIETLIKEVEILSNQTMERN